MQEIAFAQLIQSARVAARNHDARAASVALAALLAIDGDGARILAAELYGQHTAWLGSGFNDATAEEDS